MAKNKDMIHDKIKRYIGLVDKHISVEKVILFGSWVDGNQTDRSDIDLAIFSRDFGQNPLGELQLLSKLAWEIDVSIEALPYSANLLDTKDPRKFVYKIIETGETVYEKALVD